MSIRVLFVCIHNSGRSQMAEAFMNSQYSGDIVAESAGFEPQDLNRYAIDVMHEVGLDISKKNSDSVFEFYKQGKRYNYIITVCDEGAAEKCPVFPGVSNRIHISFKDPAAIEGDDESKLAQVREIRDAIKKEIERLGELIVEGKLDENAPKEWRVQK